MRPRVSMILAALLVLAAAGRAGASIMEVRPGAEHIFASSGPPGGPFAPAQITYTVRNAGSSRIEWTATRTQGWIALSAEGGALEPGQTTTVVLSVDPGQAGALAGGGYADDVVFRNLTTDMFVKTSGAVATGPTTRLITLNVARPGIPLDQGFGGATAGGAAGEVFRVVTLQDNGDDAAPIPGSLRQALSRGDRHVVFDVAGEILLQTHLYVRGAHLTIDGLSAPPPGVTLRNYGLILRGREGAHDVVVRGLRIRDLVRAAGPDTQFDGIQVFLGAFNIVIDRVSIDGADDGSIDISGDSHDVTVSWSILARPKSGGKNMLIKYRPSRVTLHHNLFVDARTRNPQVELDGRRGVATDTTLDMRNNVVWNFARGTEISKGAIGNVVANLYSRRSGAIKATPPGAAHVAGNIGADGREIKKRGPAAPFAAPAVETASAAVAACQVLAGAGMRPLDATDLQRLARIALPGCQPGEPPTVRLTAPAGGPVAGTLPVATVTSASVVAVRFFLDGLALGPELTSPPFVLDWDTTAIPDGAHVLQARARDAAGVVAVSPGLPVVVGND